MNDIAEVLERFNRKERNLLVRHVLGHDERPLILSSKFLEQIQSALPALPIRLKECWWATDYHINWLAGALAYYTEGCGCLNHPRPNRPPGLSSTESSGRLVEGNQEDIDLVIASGLHLIFIEAKAYGTWDDEQLQSKLERLLLLRAEYEKIAAQEDVAKRVQMHFLLISPPESKPDKINVDWCRWTGSESSVPWIELKLSRSEPILEVSRCECDYPPKRSAKGNCWYIVEH